MLFQSGPASLLTKGMTMRLKHTIVYLPLLILPLLLLMGYDDTVADSRVTDATASNLIQAPSYVEVPDSNPALMEVMQSVTQIQIRRPRGRHVEVDAVTGLKSRDVQDETTYCMGTVIHYKGRPFVITAAHCLVSSCINNDASQPGFDPNTNGVYNKPPTLSGIKIPSQPQVARKSSSTATSRTFPTLDAFDWEDPTQVLVARDVEFVSGTIPGAPGNSFTGTLQQRFADADSGTPLFAKGGIKALNGLLTTMDIAVIDFGPDVASQAGRPAYPMVSLPEADFQTHKLLVGDTQSVSEPSGRFMGIAFSDHAAADGRQHFRKSFRPINHAECLAVQPGKPSARDCALGIPVPFANGDSDRSGSFLMSLGFGRGAGQSGAPVFEEIPVPSGFTYQLAGIASVAETADDSSSSGHVTGHPGATTGTFTAMKPELIHTALAKIVGRSVSGFPANIPKTPAGADVDLWFPVPVGSFTGQANEDRFISAVFSSPVLVSNSTTVLWKPLTKSDGVTKVASQVAGESLMAIATDGRGQRKATWKAASLAYGYYTVDIQFPKNINSSSSLQLDYETNPLKVKTVKGSKVITIMAEGSPTKNLGAYSGNEIALGSPVKGIGIPAGATVTIVPATRTSSTFTMSVAATATSVSTGTPMIVTHTFRNRVDQKTGHNPGVDSFMKFTQSMLPFKRPATTAAKWESNVWVPALANTISAGSLTLIMHDKGSPPGARMTADTVIFTFVGGLK